MLNCCCYCYGRVGRATRAIRFGENQKATTMQATWLDVWLEMWPFHSLAWHRASMLSHLLRYIVNTLVLTRIAERWSTCTSTPKQKRTNEPKKKTTTTTTKSTKISSANATRVCFFVIYNIKCVYITLLCTGWSESLSRFHLHSIRIEPIYGFAYEKNHTHWLRLSLRNACFGFNCDQVSW